MTRDVWLQCTKKWPKVSRPVREDGVCSFMKRYFHHFSFCTESTPSELRYPTDFQASMESVLGVPLIGVDNTGPNGFFEAFCLGYLGKPGNDNVIQRLRQCVCAYVVFGWNDRNLRDWFIGSFRNFVSRDHKNFDLFGALSIISNDPASTTFRATEAVEMHCVGLVLSCQVIVLSLNSDSTVSCVKCGSDGSGTLVYCVRTKNHEYFGVGVPKTDPASTSNLSSCSRVGNDDWGTATSSPYQSESVLVSLTSPSSISLSLSSQPPPPSPASAPPEDFSDWGKPPPVNSDSHLRSTWPETEAVLRSLGLYHGIHTDAQHLQQINWIHRVFNSKFLFKIFQVLYKNIVMHLYLQIMGCCLTGEACHTRRSKETSAQEQGRDYGHLLRLLSVPDAEPFFRNSMEQAQTT